MPRGEQRDYASPRKYKLDLTAKTATEVWNFELGQSLLSHIALVSMRTRHSTTSSTLHLSTAYQTQSRAQLIGLNAADQTIFRYQYPSLPGCRLAFNSLPIHLENTKFPTVGPQALNLSTRGTRFER